MRRISYGFEDRKPRFRKYGVRQFTEEESNRLLELYENACRGESASST
jgi:hypothetical protein